MIIGFGVWFYIYVSQNHSYLVERNFRVLATWSQEIQHTFKEYRQSIEFRLKENQKWDQEENHLSLKSDEPIEKGKILESYEQTFSVSESVSAKNFTDKEIEQELQKILPFVQKVQLSKASPLPQPSTVQSDADPKSQESPPSSIEKFSLTPTQKPGQLQYTATLLDTTIKATIALDQLIHQIATQPVFEDLLLIHPKGNIVYQHNPTTLNFSHVQTLLLNQREENGWWEDILKKSGLDPGKPVDPTKRSAVLQASTPAHIQVIVGGSSFEVFMQGVRFPQVDTVGHSSTLSSTSWILCGLLPTERFQEQYLAVPFSGLLLCMFLLISLFLGLPFFSLHQMNPRERLSRFSIGMLFICNILGAGLGTYFLLDLVTYDHIKSQFKDQLFVTTQTIHDAFQTQLDHLLWQLWSYDQRIDQLGDLTQFPDSKDSKAWISRINIPDPCLEGPPISAKLCDPNFSVVFWVDRHSQLRETWTQGPTPYVRGVHDLEQRDYVSAILSHGAGLNHRILNGQPIEFYAQPLISLESSERNLVLSISHHGNAHSPAATGPWVAAIQSDALALLQPAVLPPGAGFAVIQDSSGLVLFHSDSHRMLRENFLEETDKNPELAALIHARTEGTLEGHYWGTGHQFSVKPIDDLPWTLIVFRSKELSRTINFEILIFSTCLFSLYAVALLVSLNLLSALYRHHPQGRPIRWLWPRHEARPTYNFLSMLHLGLLVFGVGSCLFLDWKWGLGNRYGLIALLIPLLGLWLTLRCLWNSCCQNSSGKVSEESDPWANSDSSGLLKTYTRFVFVTCLLLGVFPALIFFKMAHDEEMRLYAHQQVWGLAQAIKKQIHQPWLALGKGDRPEAFQYLTSQNPCLIPGCRANLDQENHPDWIPCHLPETRDTSRGFLYALHGLYTDLSFPLCLSFSQTPLSTPTPNPFWLSEFHKLVRKSSLQSRMNRQSWGFITLNPSNSSFPWSRTFFETKQYLDLRFSYFPQEHPETLTFAPLFIRTSISLFPWNLNGGFFSLCVWGLLISLLGYFLIRLTIQKIFPFWSFGPPTQDILMADPPPACQGWPNLLLLGVPGVDLQMLQNRVKDQCWFFDLTNLAPDTSWAQSTLTQIPDDSLPVVVNMRTFPDKDSKQHQEHRLFLESLLVRKIPICILAQGLPQEFLPEPLSASQATPSLAFSGSWTHIFSSFALTFVPAEQITSQVTMWLQPRQEIHNPENKGAPLPVKQTLLDEAHPTPFLKSLERWIRTRRDWPMWSPNEMEKYFGETAFLHYHALWEACSLTEQQALFHVAEEGYLHAQNPELSTLCHRGLLRMNPDIQVMNRSFRLFVLERANTQRLKEWENQTQQETWTSLKGPFLLIFGVIVIFLYSTQPEFKNSFITLISLLPVLLPTLPEFPLLFSSRKISEPSSG